ncbi:cytochrome P450 94C1-like [Curcuma longa]|uniref:cytochrome P450 94C1-like n=1 Tax=Curcuma longa TaxID=136217 RepID=UPI003D9F1D79
MAELVTDHLAFVFFGFAAVFMAFALLLLLLWRRPCCCFCSCHVCRAYLSGSWAAEFDNLGDWYTHLLRASSTATIHLHVLGNTVTANPANVEYMLQTRFVNFPKGKHFAAVLGDLLGHGIFNVDGDAWRFQRKMASLAVGSVSVRAYAAGVIDEEIARGVTQRLCSVADNGGAVDLQCLFRRFAFDTICRISFGLERGSLEVSVPMDEFVAAFDTASRLSAMRGAAWAPVVWKLKRLLNIGSERELRRAVGMINALAKEVIRQRRKLGYAAGHDLLSRFMRSVEDDDEYLRDIVVSFLLAGRDTIASGLTGFFLLLTRNPRAAALVRKEINAGSGRDYVMAAIHESLRLFPPVQFDSKWCTDDDVLPDGTFVRKGTRVTYHPYAMGRMESIWGADCGEFLPERWLHGDQPAFASESLFKFPVFQAGSRVCLGKELALMEMKKVVVAVLGQFDVEVVDANRPVKFAPGLTTTFSGGVWARVGRRVAAPLATDELIQA